MEYVTKIKRGRNTHECYSLPQKEIINNIENYLFYSVVFSFDVYRMLLGKEPIFDDIEFSPRGMIHNKTQIHLEQSNVYWI